MNKFFKVIDISMEMINQIKCKLIGQAFGMDQICCRIADVKFWNYDVWKEEWMQQLENCV